MRETQLFAQFKRIVEAKGQTNTNKSVKERKKRDKKEKFHHGHMTVHSKAMMT